MSNIGQQYVLQTFLPCFISGGLWYVWFVVFAHLYHNLGTHSLNNSTASLFLQFISKSNRKWFKKLYCTRTSVKSTSATKKFKKFLLKLIICYAMRINISNDVILKAWYFEGSAIRGIFYHALRRPRRNYSQNV